MNYQSVIIENLSKFPGIINHPDRVKEINNILIILEEKGFKKLVANFCNQEDSDRAYDILFEMWICRVLLTNQNIKNLQYEPSDSIHPPDFRFEINQTYFDIQVKRLHNVYNEISKRLFQRECKRRLSKITKSWFINYGISKKFKREHLNPFFQYLKKNINHFVAVPSLSETLKTRPYYWPNDNDKLVSFSFSEKQKQNNKISIGIIFNNVGGLQVEYVPVEPIRQSVRRILKKAKLSLTKEITSRQSNIIIMKTASELWFDEDTMLDVLYGDDCTELTLMPDGSEKIKDIRANNGLLRSDTFSTVCGLIFVPNEAHLNDIDFKGFYFPHPLHLKTIEAHPKIFNSLKFCCPSAWFNK